jgi:hypothetical protein
VATAKLWRRSWILGWQDADRALLPACWMSRWKVRQRLLSPSLVPAVDSSSPGPAGAGSSRSRLQVVPQRGHRGWVQRHQAGLAELAVAHPQQPVVVGVEVVAVEPDRLTDAHPADGQQPDQGLVGHRPKRVGQGAGGVDERGDVGLGVQVRGCRRGPDRSSPGGGTSARASRVCRWAAKPRTVNSRCAHQRGVASVGNLAQASASSMVGTSAL